MADTNEGYMVVLVLIDSSGKIKERGLLYSHRHFAFLQITPEGRLFMYIHWLKYITNLTLSLTLAARVWPLKWFWIEHRGNITGNHLEPSLNVGHCSGSLFGHVYHISIVLFDCETGIDSKMSFLLRWKPLMNEIRKKEPQNTLLNIWSIQSHKYI